MNKEGRSTQPVAPTSSSAELSTFSGNRGLQQEEPLIFELGRDGHCGVDLPEPTSKQSRLGGLERKSAVGLPGLSEPEVVRHFVRLSQKNYAIDAGIYPLGSCTMTVGTLFTLFVLPTFYLLIHRPRKRPTKTATPVPNLA